MKSGLNGIIMGLGGGCVAGAKIKQLNGLPDKLYCICNFCLKKVKQILAKDLLDDVSSILFNRDILES